MGDWWLEEEEPAPPWYEPPAPSAPAPSGGRPVDPGSWMSPGGGYSGGPTDKVTAPQPSYPKYTYTPPGGFDEGGGSYNPLLNPQPPTTTQTTTTGGLSDEEWKAFQKEEQRLAAEKSALDKEDSRVKGEYLKLAQMKEGREKDEYAAKLKSDAEQLQFDKDKWASDTRRQNAADEALTKRQDALDAWNRQQAADTERYRLAQLGLSRDQIEAQMQQSERDYQLQQQQFEWQKQQAVFEENYRQQVLEQERKVQLANLAAQPRSWLEYAQASDTVPMVQPWMLPLMPQEYAGTVAGAPVPGWEGGALSMAQLPTLTTPSRQYEARMGPTAYEQYAGYEQARSGIRPEELQWRSWMQAPPQGRFQQLRYGK